MRLYGVVKRAERVRDGRRGRKDVGEGRAVGLACSVIGGGVTTKESRAMVGSQPKFQSGAGRVSVPLSIINLH